MKRLLIVVLIFLLVPAQASSKWIAGMAKDFTHKGKTIHPKLFLKFNPWVSDGGPGPVIAVDLTAQVEGNGNQFFADVKNDSGLISCTYRLDGYPDREGYAAYRYIGRLENGLFVVQTYDRSGGTAVWQNVLLLRMIVTTRYDEDQKKPALVAFLYRTIDMMERSSDKVSLSGNKVLFTKEGQSSSYKSVETP